MRCAICDDDPLQAELLGHFVRSWALSHEVEIKWSVFSSAESFWFAWADDPNYDLLILDIQMGEMNGMELAHRIRQEASEVIILFVTAFRDFMAEGYEVDALHYLLKPVEREKLFECLDRAMLRRRNTEERMLLFECEEGLRRIRPEEILYVETQDHRTSLYLKAETLSLRLPLRELEKMLGEEEFVRIHRAFLVRFGAIRRLEGRELTLSNGKILNVSRGQAKEVREKFFAWHRRALP